MRRGKYSIYIFFCFFLYLNHSFSETTANIKIDDLDELPSTYEEVEEYIEEDNIENIGFIDEKINKKKYNQTIMEMINNNITKLSYNS